MLSEELKGYLKNMKIDVKFFEFEEHTMTVDAAVKRLGVSREKIVKSIIFVDNAGLPLLAIVTGNKRVSEEKLAGAAGVRRVRRANPVEVKNFTGYDVGAVPPVGHKTRIRTFIDERVMTYEKVIGGGGQINMLLEISPTEIRRLTNGEVKDISE
ncbi:MAG: aminoacyl-tRNA deacylase [Candidatus Bathyarchaeales archaeon]